MKKDTRDIARGVLTNFAGILLGSLNFAFYVFLSRAYGAEVVGIFVFSRSSIDIISKLGISGLDMGVLTIAAKSKAKGNIDAMYRTIGQAITMGMVATVFVLLLFEFIMIPLFETYYQKKELVLPLRIMGLGMVFWTISFILLCATRSLRIMRYDVIVKTIVEPVGIFVFALLFYYLDFGITGLSVAFVLSIAMGTGVTLYFFSKEFSLSRIGASLFIREGRGALFRFAFPVGIYSTLNLLLQRIDLIVLTMFASPASVGVYSMVQNAAFVFKKIRQSFDPIIVPVISASHELKDKANLLLQYQNVTRWVLILNIAFLCLTFFSASSIMSIFGKDFAAGNMALIVLTSAIMINTILGVSELFILIDKPVINLINTIATLFCALALSLLLVPSYGIVGASLSILISYILMNIARVTEVHFMYGLQPFTKFHLRALLAGLPAFGIAFFAREWYPGAQGVGEDLVSVFIFLIFYFLSLILSGMAEEEKALVSRFFSKIPRMLKCS